MDKFDGHGSFADARRTALGGAMPNIPGDEDTGNARFEEERVTIGCPASGAFAIEHQVLAGNKGALSFALDRSVEPIGSRDGAGVDEERTGSGSFGRAV